MSKGKHKLLQIPQGTETFYLDEAFRHRALIRRLEGLFDSWGYLPVQTPVFDYYDIYHTLLRDDDAQSIYRLFDRGGELLMLRSDITLFLAKQMGVILEDKDLPVRVCYADSILRHQHEEDISRQEFFQVGTELIGKEGSQADLEVLHLFVQTLENLELKNYRIHLGSRKIFDQVFQGLEQKIQNTLADIIRNRDWVQLEETLETIDSIKEQKETILKLFGYVGEMKEIDSLLSLAAQLGRDVESSFQEIMKIKDELKATGLVDYFRFDSSEIGAKSYYTGIVFQAYIPNVATSIASGGRYDKLLGHFGFEAPSAGFSLYLRKVEPLIELDRKESSMTITDEGSFAEKYKKAELLRKEGKTVLF